MPEFLKFSGFSDKRIKQIINTCNEITFENYDVDAPNPLMYLEYVLNSILVGEPTSELKPLLVFLGQYDPDNEPDPFSPSLDMAGIKKLTESRLLAYNTAIKTVQSENTWEGHQQYFKL